MISFVFIFDDRTQAFRSLNEAWEVFRKLTVSQFPNLILELDDTHENLRQLSWGDFIEYWNAQ